ncbi:MAG: hypothetical protein RSG92_15325 [Pseudomonas sp.]
MTQLSFNNDPALKALHVEQAERHAALDMLAAGTYGEGEGAAFRGCSVGCFAHDIAPDSDDHHTVVAEARGLPEWLIRLQDSMFEGLPAADRAVFHVELARAIPVGVDLAPVPHLIAVDRIDRLIRAQQELRTRPLPENVTAAIDQVIGALEIGRRAHEAAAGGNTCQLETARSAARSAAESAWSAWSAAESAAWAAESAARSAAESAAWAARSAARSAAESAAWAARSAAWCEERDALFTVLRSLDDASSAT